MYWGTVLWEIACIKVRQRRILKALNDKGIMDWDGTFPSSDDEANEVLKQIQKGLDDDNAPLGERNSTSDGSAKT
jgi:hypothetical protein